MKKLYGFILPLLFTALSLARPITPSTRIALLDVTLRTPESYNTLISLTKAVGTTLVYMHPSKNLSRDLCGCDGAFIVFDPYFLLASASEYAKLIIDPLKQLVSQKTKIIGLLLPDRVLNHTTTPLILKFLRSIGLDATAGESAINTFLMHKKEAVPLYATAQQSAATHTITVPDFENALVLPCTKVPAFLHNNMPLGIEIKCIHNNRILLTTLSALSFTDLQENSFINPLDPHKRKALLREALNMLAYLQQQQTKLKQESITAVKYSVINKLINNNASKLTCTMFKKQQGMYKWTSNGICCGWLSVDYDKEFIPTNLAYVAKTDFDVLWLELPIGLYKEPEKFAEKIRFFSTQLVTAYQEAHRELPKIIIDFNLGAILQWYHYASTPIDIYGNHYQNIPAPLDFDHFWHPALIDVFSNVIKNWNTITNNKLPIDGVLFNLYFWNTKNHRIAMPFYCNLIDFSDSAWKFYLQKNTPQESINSVLDRINYLLKNNKLEEYLAELERGAFEIGQHIVNDLHSILPCAMVGIYTNAPLDTWFYRGFARALGSPERPLLWFTENLDFYGHQTWLENNKIHALHSTNILLHHFNSKKDVPIINKLAKSHDGLWYSRISRIGEQYEPNKWWSAEATTMDPEQLIKLIEKQARKL